MENALLTLVQGGLNLDTVVLVVQLVVVAFLALALRGWIMQTWAWHKFTKSTQVGIGTEMAVSINGVQLMRGRISNANKSRIVISDEHRRALIRTQDFIKQSWVIYDMTPQPQDQAAKDTKEKT